MKVDDANKGPTSGTDLPWREWDGPWHSGARDRAGERLVVFLRQPSATGLTSPLRVLKVHGGQVHVQRRSVRLGATEAAIPYRDYVRALRAMQ
jgi:hypothetical protein